MTANTFHQSTENEFIAISPMFKKAGIEMVQFALESGNIEALLEKAVQLLKTALHTSLCCTFVFSPDRDSFDLKSGTGRLKSLSKNCKFSADIGSYPGCALYTAEPFMVKDFATESRCTVPSVFAECGIKSGMSMPFGETGRSHGIIAVYSDVHPEFTIEDVDFFLAFSRILTSAVIRIQTVDTLKKSRADLSHAQRIASMGNWEWDLLTGKVYWSDEIFRIFGIPKQPPGIRLAESLTHPADLAICHSTFKQLKEQNRPFQIDYRMIRPDGRIIWVYMEVTVIRDNANRPVSIFGIIQDITDRKETEQALRESKKLYRSVVENAYEIISIVQDKIIRYVNPAMERLIGYTPDEMIGTEFSKFMFYEDQKKALDTYHKITPDSPFQEVYSGRLKHKNGSIFVCEITAGPIVYEGKPASLMTARNITDRIKFEKDKDRLLRQFQRKALEMESLFNATRMLLEEKAFKPIARHLFDTCRRLTGGQYGYVSLLKENGSKSVVQFLETDGWQGGVKAKLPMPVQGMWEAACRQDQPIVENDFKKSRWAKNLPEGHIPFENILIIRLMLDGKPVGLMGIANKPGDFTKNDANIAQTLGELAAISLKNDRMKKALHDSEKYLRQSQKMEALGTLAGGIAHDFNNILASILGFTELSLNKTETESSIHANLQGVLRAGLRAKDLVNQILIFARQSETKVKPIQVSKVAKEVLKLIRASIPASIKIVEQIKTDTMIMADPTQIHQIMMNLCTNAAYAMKTNGGILMIMIEEAMLDGKFAAVTKGITPGIHIRITVTDTGEGISPDVMDMIFEPYYTTKPIGEGTGLGLSLIHGIVKECRGTITVNSEKGKGSSFKIYLPAIRGKTDKEIKKKRIIPVSSERILFVDDELQLVKLGRRRLESIGYRLRAGPVALKRCRHLKPCRINMTWSSQICPCRI